MTDRLKSCFDACHREGRAALVGYLMAGDPNPTDSEELFLALAPYVDILEVGIPFSDPMADGPVIQTASERALRAGTKLKDVFHLVRRVRSEYPKKGIVLMGYANVVFRAGFKAFCEHAKEAGADGLLVVDMPPEESASLDRALREHGLHAIRLLTPTSDRERIKKVAENASGFIYYVSITGITGAAMGEVEDVRRHVQAIRAYTPLPICVGFGVKTPSQVKAIASFADGVVIGSFFVSQVAQHESDLTVAASMLKEKANLMRNALVKSTYED